MGSKAATLEDPRLTGQSQSGGTGDGRMVGGGGTGSGIPRNWEVHFLAGSTLEDYAKQLDFFGIEMGVLMPDNKVVYARNLSKSRPDTRTGPADAEKRYYLTWRAGNLQQADRELLARVGIISQHRIILKFLPPAVEARLAALEKMHAGREPAEILRTRFGISPEGSKYSFFVIQQSPRR